MSIHERATDSTRGRPLVRGRVAYFVSYPQRMAGANRSLRQLVLGLRPSYEPLVIATDEGRVTEAYRHDGVAVHVLRPGRDLHTYGKGALRWSSAQRARVLATQLAPYWWRVRRFLGREAVSLLHVNDTRGALLAAPAAASLRIPVVVHERGERAVGGTIARFADSVSTRHIAVSRAVADALPHARRIRTSVVYNGTDDVATPGPSVPELERLRAKGIVTLVCMASIVPFKGHHHLLQALGHLRARLGAGRFACFVAGDFVDGHEAYHRYLERRRDELGLEMVAFVGWQDDPFRYYRSADVSVMVSVSRERLVFDDEVIDVRGNEGFPRTHLEAMCFGLPCVGTGIVGVPEQIVDGETGFVVPPGDPKALADVLEQLVCSGELRERLGAAGRRRVLDVFSTERYVAGVTEVYERLLGR